MRKVTAKFLLRTKPMGLPLKILLLVPKPTGKLLPSFPHNFHLWLKVCCQALLATDINIIYPATYHSPSLYSLFKTQSRKFQTTSAQI